MRVIKREVANDNQNADARLGVLSTAFTDLTISFFRINRLSV